MYQRWRKDNGSFLSPGNKIPAAPSPVLPPLSPSAAEEEAACSGQCPVVRGQVQRGEMTVLEHLLCAKPFVHFIGRNGRLYSHVTKERLAQGTHTVIWVWEEGRQEHLEGVKGKVEPLAYLVWEYTCTGHLACWTLGLTLTSSTQSQSAEGNMRDLVRGDKGRAVA